MMNVPPARNGFLTREGRVFIIGSAFLALAAAVALWAASGSFLTGVAALIAAFMLQITGKELARGTMRKTGTRAPEDYHSASFLGWLVSIILGAFVIWALIAILWL